MNSVSLLSELKRGQRAVIESITNEDISLKLLEMGCIPGEIVEVTRVAPLGDPIAIQISGYQLSLRRSEASSVKVQVLE